MKHLKEGIINENPLFVLMLGLCSSLAITTTLENAIIMGLTVTVILMITNLIASLIKKIVPEHLKIIMYIIIIATLVTVIELVLDVYLSEVFTVFGIYLPLIVVNCIILGRAIGFASKERVGISIIDGLGAGMGYTLALMFIASVREIFGTGSLTIMNHLSKITGYEAIYKIIPNNDYWPVSFLLTPAGAFFTLFILLTIFNSMKKDVKR